MLVVASIYFSPVSAFEGHHTETSRSNFIRQLTASVASTAAIVPAASAAPKFADRLNEDILNLPAPSYSSELNGVDNTYFPDFLEGTWDVTQTLVDTKAPMGLKFLGGPNGDLSIADKTMKEARSQVDVPVSLQLKYVSTKWGIAEDRIFNTQSRLNGFARKSVVASVSYADVGGSNRQSVVALGGKLDDPLQTTLVYFKGPAAQKNFVVSHGGEKLGQNNWVGYEVQRSIFALTNQNTAPPITTDSECIWEFKMLDEKTVLGKLRIAGYLNAQSDKLYFEARNRAVSLQDYALEMTRIN